MRRVLALLGLLSASAFSLHADDGAARRLAAPDSTAAYALAVEESQAIQKVIRDQMEAFRSDDAEAAFSYAAPGTKAIFRTPQTYIQIVKRRYRAVYRARHIAFREVLELAGRVVQPVMVIGDNLIPVTALYIMERQPGGDWRIGGVVFADEPAEAI